MSAIVGTWDLVAFTTTFSDGRPVQHPYGERPVGRIVYTGDGHVSAVLSRADRAGGTDLETAFRATEAEKAAWFDSYLSYAGRWRVEGDEVVHTLELALLPSMVGSEVRRRFVLDQERLVLCYTRTPRSGVTRTFTLTWERSR